MTDLYQQVRGDMDAVVDEWKNSGYLKENDLFVVGCSTSEVTGQHIGTAGSEEIAFTLFEKLEQLQQETQVRLAFQCCEHVNRALVVESSTKALYQLDEVAVIPATNAGGSMATQAYHRMSDPVVVETIQASAGIDIGETMIGMQLKHVAVPLRMKQRQVGNANLQAARTRPKLIGGERAVYR